MGNKHFELEQVTKRARLKLLKGIVVGLFLECVGIFYGVLSPGFYYHWFDRNLPLISGMLFGSLGLGIAGVFLCQLFWRERIRIHVKEHLIDYRVLAVAILEDAQTRMPELEHPYNKETIRTGQLVTSAFGDRLSRIAGDYIGCCEAFSAKSVSHPFKKVALSWVIIAFIPFAGGMVFASYYSANPVAVNVVLPIGVGLACVILGIIHPLRALTEFVAAQEIVRALGDDLPRVE